MSIDERTRYLLERRSPVICCSSEKSDPDVLNRATCYYDVIAWRCQSTQVLFFYFLQTGVRLPEGASAALAKPTKYHYYPHNQHIYLLPECAVQQVCNAVYVRLNFTQPLCACPGRYRDPCSASLDSDDLHTTELVTDPRTKVGTNFRTTLGRLRKSKENILLSCSTILSIFYYEQQIRYHLRSDE